MDIECVMDPDYALNDLVSTRTMYRRLYCTMPVYIQAVPPNKCAFFRLPPSFFVSVDNRYGVTYSHTGHRHRGNTHGPAFYFIDSLNTAAHC